MENTELATSGLPVLDQMSEEGFVDLLFRIQGWRHDATHYHFHLAASHRDEEVGIDVSLLVGIQGGLDSDVNLISTNVYRQGVTFRRSGAESDRLVAAIGQLYGMTKSLLRMVDCETYTAIALHQGQLDFESTPIQLKIFGNDNEPIVEDDYYESFFNLDYQSGIACWNEKDPDYRDALLRAISLNSE